MLINFKRMEKKIFHLELGEPIPKTPKAVLNEASRLSRLSLPGYTPSNGIEELRERISKFYKSRYNLKINSDQIFITTGSSGAFLLTFLSCFDKGSRVAIFNPVYPAYRNILKSLNIDVIEIFPDKNKIDKIDPFFNFKAKRLTDLLFQTLIILMVRLLHNSELKFIYEYCKKNKVILISDEIYHGIEYGKRIKSMLNYGNKAIVINSFSKFFCMPGWRLGWAIIPKELKENFLKLSQNLFISSGNIAQYSALKVFDSINELNEIVKVYHSTRNKVLKILKNIPLIKFSEPQGIILFLYRHTKYKTRLFQICK